MSLPVDFQQQIMQHFAPPPKLTVSQWADRYRQLSAEAASEPGQWRTSRAPYQRGIMDAVNDPDTETVVFMKSAQVGATELVNNIVGYFISQDPSPILVVQPSLEMAHAWSKDRLATMIRDCEVLKVRVRTPRSKDSNNTILHKVFPGGHITISGANSPASLASRPIRIVLCDEIDRYPPSAGAEGDPVALATKRSTTFWNRIHLLVSTPTLRGLSRIEAAFRESDQRYFHVPCHACGKKQKLAWANIRWERAPSGAHLPETARYCCTYCGGFWDDAERWASLQEGEWIAENPNAEGIAGFHIFEAYSPWVRLADMVDRFLKSRGNPERLKTFVNTALGETWEDEGEKLESEDLYSRRETYGAQVPEGGFVLTCGVDVQDDRIEGEVIAWGVDEESWSVEYFTIMGDLATKTVWEELDAKLASTYQHESGITLKIACSCIDSGGHFTDAVYRFCKGKLSRRIFAVKGSSTVGSPIISRPSKNNKGKVHLYTVGTDTAKQQIYAALKMDEAGAGYMHFPKHYDEEYFKQLTAEKIVTRYKRGFPQRVWEKIRPRNEALDCRVYGLAALRILNPAFKKIARSFEKIRAEQDAIEEAQEKPKKKPGKRKGSWLGKGWK